VSTELAIDEPARWDLRVKRGTDHLWECRRVDEADEPIIPTAAEAQLRKSPGGEVWAELDVAIDAEDGWIALTLPEADTSGAEWDTRKSGVWDLEVVVSGRRLRWASGAVTVSQDVTRDE
jgi:hypothetical protein